MNIALISFGYIPSNEIVRSYDRAMFNIASDRQTIVQSGCTKYISTSKVWQFCLLLILVDIQ